MSHFFPAKPCCPPARPWASGGSLWPWPGKVCELGDQRPKRRHAAGKRAVHRSASFPRPWWLLWPGRSPRPRLWPPCWKPPGYRKLARFRSLLPPCLLHPGPYISGAFIPGDFPAVFAANVMAGHQLIRCCLPILLCARARGWPCFSAPGREKTQPGIAAYCAAKAAGRAFGPATGRRSAQRYHPDLWSGYDGNPMQVQARGSQGGAAKQLRAVFRPWKEQGQLMTQEQSSSGTGPAAGQGPTPPASRELGHARFIIRKILAGRCKGRSS